jgi:hypothetical protein
MLLLHGDFTLKLRNILAMAQFNWGLGGLKMALFRGSSSVSTLTFSTFSQLST